MKDKKYPRAMAAGLSLLRIICSCKQVRIQVVGIGLVVQLVELLPIVNHFFMNRSTSQAFKFIFYFGYIFYFYRASMHVKCHSHSLSIESSLSKLHLTIA